MRQLARRLPGSSVLARGLGFDIQITTGNMRPELAFAGIFFLTGIGHVLFGLISLAERSLIRWHISVRRLEA